MKKTEIKSNLNSLSLSDVYSLLFFLLWKTEELPEYETLSHLCFLLDGNNLTRLLTYFSGQTITIPNKEDFKIIVNALLMYQYINIEGKSLVDAQSELNLTDAQKETVLETYLKIIPLIKDYIINKGNLDIYGQSKR